MHRLIICAPAGKKAETQRGKTEQGFNGEIFRVKPCCDDLAVVTGWMLLNIEVYHVENAWRFEIKI